LYEYCRGVNLISVQVADIGQLFNFSDCGSGSHGHYRIEIAGGLAIHEIAPAVALPGFNECEIRGEGAFHHVHATFELACFLALRHKRAIARWSVESRYAGAARPDAFGKC